MYSYAQGTKPEIKWGETMPEEDQRAHRVVGVDDDFFYVVGGEDLNFYDFAEDFFVKKFDRTDLSVKYTLDVEGFKFQSEEAQLVHAMLLKGNLELFFKVHNEDKQLVYLLNRTVDQDGTLSNIREIAQFSCGESMEDEFRFSWSKDSTKVLIVYSYVSDDHDNEAFQALVLDRNFSLQWKKEAEIPCLENRFLLLKAGVSNDGDVFVSGQEALSIKQGSEGFLRAEVTPKLFKLSENINGIREVPLRHTYKEVFSLDFELDIQENTLAAFGFYEDGQNGLYYQTVEQKSMHRIEQREVVFRKGLSDDVRGVSTHELVKHHKFYGFEFKNYLPQSDGGLVLIAEKLVDASGFYGRIGHPHKWSFARAEIVVIKLDAAGKLKWAVAVPKLQREEASNYNFGYNFDYSLLVDGDAFHFIFNDRAINSERLEEGENPLPVFIRGIFGPEVTVMVSVDAFGHATRTVLRDTEENDEGLLVPALSQKTGQGELLIYEFYDDLARFGKMRMK
jgi:hypothetical protein